MEHNIFEFAQKIEQIPEPGNYEELQKERKGVTIEQRLKDEHLRKSQDQAHTKRNHIS